MSWASPGAAQCFPDDPEIVHRGLREESAQQGGAQEERRVTSWRRLPRNLLLDQKAIWTKPAHLKRSDWKIVVPLAAVTGGLIARDKDVAQALTDSPPGTGFAFSKRVGQFGSLAADLGVAGAFYGFGKWRGDPYAADTGILATEALLNTVIVVELLKTVTRRERPTTADGRVRLDDARGGFEVGGRSFPSGHSAEAWALASVVAHRYPRRWSIVLPSYGLAGLVSVSRVTGRKHFPSDIVVGAALGYFIGRYVAHRDTTGPDSGAPAKSRRVRVSLLPSSAPQGGYTTTLHIYF